MITPNNLLRHELTGLKVRVKTRDAVVEGEVEEETTKTLRIKTASGERTVVKDQQMLEFILPQGEVVEVEGRLFMGRPADRIKKKQRIRF